MATKLHKRASERAIYPLWNVGLRLVAVRKLTDMKSGRADTLRGPAYV